MRWEDYTQTAMDPADDCTIWYGRRLHAKGRVRVLHEDWGVPHARVSGGRGGPAARAASSVNAGRNPRRRTFFAEPTADTARTTTSCRTTSTSGSTREEVHQRDQ